MNSNPFPSTHTRQTGRHTDRQTMGGERKQQPAHLDHHHAVVVLPLADMGGHEVFVPALALMAPHTQAPADPPGRTGVARAEGLLNDHHSRNDAMAPLEIRDPWERNMRCRVRDEGKGGLLG